MTAAKLIAPAIETSFAAGFDWFVLLFYNSDQFLLWNRDTKSFDHVSKSIINRMSMCYGAIF